MTAKRQILPADIMDMAAYGAERAARRGEISRIKRTRRVAVGPFATFHFESYDTMWMQVHEMLFVEGGGEGQVPGELNAYNPLIPGGKNLIATLMFEIADSRVRGRELARLGGVESSIRIELGDSAIAARPLDDGVERTNDDGKTSAVHFLSFDFSAGEIEKFRDAQVPAVISISHSNYGHMAVIPEDTRQALAGDFD
jgi:hypothetical protein